MLPRAQQLLRLQREARQPRSWPWSISALRGLRTRRCVPVMFVAVAALPDACSELLGFR